jgi:hypothetical protein
MLKENDRKILIITFIAGILFLLASISQFWSNFVNKERLGFLPLAFAVLAIVAFIYHFIVAYRTANIKQQDALIEEKVAEGRAALLTEIRSEEEKKKEEITETDDVPQIAKSIAPSGNFKNIESYGKKLLVNFSDHLNCIQGVFYAIDASGETFNALSSYAMSKDRIPEDFTLGENMNGQAAKTQEITYISEIPENYFEVESGLGKSKAGYLCLIPVVSDNKTVALIELASFSDFKDKHKRIIEQTIPLITNKIPQIVKA